MNTSIVLIHKSILMLKRINTIIKKLGIKQSTSVLVQTLKTHFFAKFCCKFVTFLRFVSFIALKHWKWLFPPALAVRSTQTLVEIYNKLLTLWIPNKFGIKIPYRGRWKKIAMLPVSCKTEGCCWSPEELKEEKYLKDITIFYVIIKFH